MTSPQPCRVDAQPRLWRRADIAFLTIILCLALFPRLIALDLVSFTADEGIHALAAMSISMFREFPLAGLPSVRIHNSALFLYALALPDVIAGFGTLAVPPHIYWAHPLSGVVFVSLLNIAAVCLAFRLTFERFGRTAAWATVSLYACSPWAVMYARNMWPPSCVAFAALVLIRETLRWLDEGGSRRLFRLTLLAFILPQIHFSGFVAVPWLAVALLHERKKLAWRPIVAGSVIGLATLTPWIYWQHFENSWLDLQLASQAAKGERTLVETLAPMGKYFFTLPGAGGFDYWFGVGPSQLPDIFPSWQQMLFHAASAIMVLGVLIALIWACVRSRNDRNVRLLLLWIVIPVLLLSLIRPVMHPHYINIAYPAPLVLMGACVGEFVSRRGRGVRAVAAIAVASLCLTFLLSLAGWLRFLDLERNTGAGHFELSFRQRRAAALAIIDDNGGEFAPIYGGFNGFHPAYEFPYANEHIRRRTYSSRGVARTAYWIDESKSATFEPPSPWRVERIFFVGPSRIVRLHQPAR